MLTDKKWSEPPSKNTSSERTQFSLDAIVEGWCVAACRKFVKRYFQANIADPINYDIVINTNHLSIEGAASIIVDAVPWLSD